MPRLREASRARDRWPGEARQIEVDEGGRRVVVTGVNMASW